MTEGLLFNLRYRLKSLFQGDNRFQIPFKFCRFMTIDMISIRKQIVDRLDPLFRIGMALGNRSLHVCRIVSFTNYLPLLDIPNIKHDVPASLDITMTIVQGCFAK